MRSAQTIFALVENFSARSATARSTGKFAVQVSRRCGIAFILANALLFFSQTWAAGPAYLVDRSFSSGFGRVWVIDTDTYTDVNIFDDDCNRAMSGALSPDGSLLYVTYQGEALWDYFYLFLGQQYSLL